MTTLIRRPNAGSLDPWRLLDDFHSRTWDLFNTPFGFTPISRMLERSTTFMPPIDVYETEDELLVFASVPGVNVSSINLQVQNGVLTVEGEQAPVWTAQQEQKVRQHVAGIPWYGRFQFSVALPVEVDTESAKAQYLDGILRIVFARPASSRPVRISLTGGGESAIEPKQIGTKSGK